MKSLKSILLRDYISEFDIDKKEISIKKRKHFKRTFCYTHSITMCGTHNCNLYIFDKIIVTTCNDRV